ncbi:MAG: NrsF family protein [Hyphomonadaceae bacterium]
MKTDDLIAFLARGAEPEQRRRTGLRMAATLAAGFAVAALALVLILGMRPDIGAAITPVLLKAAFAAAAAAAVLPLAMQLAKPGRPLGWRLAAAFVFVAVSFGAAAIALLGAPSEARMQAWTGGSFPWCLVLIPILAAPAAAGLVWLMRSFAPTRLTLSGAAIGALSGGVGAMAYAMYCPVDSIAFVTTWYVVAIAICAALGALIGARLLRW